MEIRMTIERLKDGAFLCAQIGSARTYRLFVDAETLRSIDASGSWEWREYLRDRYRTEIAECAILAGEDVATLALDSYDRTHRSWTRSVVAAAVLVVLAIGIWGAGHFEDRASAKHTKTAIERAFADRDRVTRMQIDWLIDNSAATEDGVMEQVFSECRRLRHERAVPMALLFARIREDGPTERRRSVTAARAFLSSFTRVERESACVQFAATIGRTPESTIQLMNEVFAE